MNKRLRSFGFAGRGIYNAFLSEVNLKIHFGIASAVIICGFYFNISLFEWVACLLCIGLVFGLELINTAIETIVNLVSPKHNELAGRAKDIAAGAVLLGAIISVIIGCLIFLPKISAILL